MGSKIPDEKPSSPLERGGNGASQQGGKVPANPVAQEPALTRNGNGASDQGGKMPVHPDA